MKQMNPFFSLEADNDDIDVGMDDLVKDEADPAKDYVDAVNKDVEKQDPDPDAVVKADLEMDPAAATESFICKRFGLSLEDIDEAAVQVVDEAAVIPDADETSADPDDAAVATTVTVVPPEGETTVAHAEPDGDEGPNPLMPPDGDGDEEGAVVVGEGEVAAEPELKTASDVAALEGLHRLLGMEDGEPDEGGEPDVSLNVKTPNNDMDLDFEGKAVTIEPNDDGEAEGGEEPAAEPETEGGEAAPESEPAEGGEEEGGEEKPEDQGSEEAWFI